MNIAEYSLIDDIEFIESLLLDLSEGDTSVYDALDNILEYARSTYELEGYYLN